MKGAAPAQDGARACSQSHPPTHRSNIASRLRGGGRSAALLGSTGSSLPWRSILRPRAGGVGGCGAGAHGENRGWGWGAGRAAQRAARGSVIHVPLAPRGDADVGLAGHEVLAAPRGVVAAGVQLALLWGGGGVSGRAGDGGAWGGPHAPLSFARGAVCQMSQVSRVPRTPLGAHRNVQEEVIAVQDHVVLGGARRGGGGGAS
jgi:hypothetical protein